MTFPSRQRIIYERNPLDRVICQVRFPPILRIDSEIPAVFQERIRKDFPEYNEKEEVILPLTLRSPHNPENAGDEVLRQMITSGTKNYGSSFYSVTSDIA